MSKDYFTSTLRITVYNTTPPTVKVSGEADFHNKDRISEAIEDLIKQGHFTLRADLSELRYLDSSTLAVLVKCAIRLNELSGALELTGASRQVARVLNICGAAMFFRSRVRELPINGMESDFNKSESSWRVASFSLPARPDAATLARQRLAELIRSLPLSVLDSADVMIAFGEAVANAIGHGCGSDPRRRIGVQCIAGRSRLAIDVSDPGPGFLPDRIPSPSSRSIIDGGMGIFIMRELMDEVEFFFGEGTTARLVKRIEALRDASPA